MHIPHSSATCRSRSGFFSRTLHPLSVALVFTMLLSVCALTAGCDRQEPPPSPDPAPQKPSGHIKIGLIPEQDVFAQKKRYEPLLAYLSDRVSADIDIEILPRYMNIISNFRELGLDGAFLGSFTGALAIEKLGVEPLARPQYADGSSTYYGMVFVKQGSGIRTAEDMKGKRMVFVDKATTAGYLLPLHYFRSLGIKDYRSWFGEYYFSGTHENAILDVLSGLADVGAAKNTIFYRLAARDSRVTRELEILATSPHVPANGLAVRSDLPADLKAALKRELLEMHDTPQGRTILKNMGINVFIDTTVKDYQPVFEYAASIGLDLETYTYRNN